MSSKAGVGTVIGFLCLGLFLSVTEANSASANVRQLPSVGNSVISASVTTINSSPDLPALSNPNLQCDGSGELSGYYPGWSSGLATQLTVVNIESFKYGVYWCPAAAPYGQGVITYTVTAPSGETSCVTTATSCEMSGITSQSKLEIMATDENGTSPSASSAIQNNGTIQGCQVPATNCNSSFASLTFSNYGNNSVSGIQDCTFAAVANWEKIVIGITPDPTQIESEFAQTSSHNFGLTNDQVFSYWRASGIGQTYLKAAVVLRTDPFSLINAINDPAIKAPIAELHFINGQNFAGFQIQNGSYHWVVVDGYTSTGPLVVSWGQTLQMTWQQWNYEVAAMWGISVSM